MALKISHLKAPKGLSDKDLQESTEQWTLVGADSFYCCTSTGTLFVHKRQLLQERLVVLVIPRGTLHIVTASSLRIRVRNRALAPSIPIDRLAAQIIRSACSWATEHDFTISSAGNTINTKLASYIQAISKEQALARRRAIFYQLIDHLGTHITLRADHPRAPGSAAAIRSLLDYISQNFARSCSVSEAQAMAGLNRSQFHVAFRQANGTTFTRYLTSLRIANAARDLRTTHRTIIDIAHDNGFGSVSRFYEAF